MIGDRRSHFDTTNILVFKNISLKKWTSYNSFLFRHAFIILNVILIDLF